MHPFRIIPAAAVAVLIAVPLVARAAGTAGESVYPRVYTAEDCRDLSAQLTDSMGNSRLDGGTAGSIRLQQDQADRACDRGQYAAATRQLRDLVDQVIAVRR